MSTLDPATEAFPAPPTATDATRPAATGSRILDRVLAIGDRHAGDVIALGTLYALLGIGLWLRWAYDNWLGEFDLFTMFVPWFGYVGDRIAAGEIPAWSPHYFGGQPVAGNPSGGWMYLQVMLLYAVFPILTATKMLLLTHAVIAAAALYAFARKIGMQPPAALMSATIFSLGQILYGGTNYMTIATQAITWMVVGLLAAEMAMRARRTSAVVGWAALLGVAITQMFMSWPGQGVAYGCIWIGGWMLYRVLFDPIPGLEKVADRFWQVILVGSIGAVVTLGFGAAGILPMLDFLAESTVPSGDYSNVVGGEYASRTESLTGFLSMLFKGNTNFAFTVPSEAFGATVMLLAVLGAVLAWRRYGAAYFAVMFVGAASLMITHSPTLWIFTHLPVLGHIHEHRPSGVSWLFAIGPAMLAGAAIQRLLDPDRPRLRLAHVNLLLIGLALGFATVNSQFNWTGWWGWGAAVASLFVYALPSTDMTRAVSILRNGGARIVALAVTALGLILLAGYLWPGFWIVLVVVAAGTILVLTLNDPGQVITRWQPRLPLIASYALVGLIFLNPTGWDIYTTVKDPETVVGGWTDSPGKEPESTWVIETSMLREDPGTAAEFLQNELALTGPFRYTGWSLQGEIDARWTGEENEGHKSGYSWRRMEPGVVGILVNGRTYRLGLYQTGGYNPIQLKYYTEYVDVMNGKRQDYHWLDTFTPALDGSQLLDMLNVRYILVDNSIPEYRTALQQIQNAHTPVYEDNLVTVYENQEAFPHAWIVHNIEDNGNGAGLSLLNSGEVDGHVTAFVNADGELPELETLPSGNLRETAIVTRYEPERITLSTTAVAEGFLVLSEPFASGWNAYVDGEKTDIYRTNHALRGIVVPEGQHTVEFRYEPQSLQVGMYITGATSIALIGIWAWALVDWRRRGTSGPIDTGMGREGTFGPDPDPIDPRTDTQERQRRRWSSWRGLRGR